MSKWKFELSPCSHKPYFNDVYCDEIIHRETWWHNCTFILWMLPTVNVWTKIPKEFQFRCYSVPVILTMHQNEMDHFLFIIWPKTKNPKLHWVPFSSPSFLSISTKNKGKFHKHPYWFPFSYPYPLCMIFLMYSTISGTYSLTRVRTSAGKT